MGVVDRSALFMKAFTEAMGVAGLIRRILHFFQLVAMMVFMIAPTKLKLNKGKVVTTQVTKSILAVRYGATVTNSFAILGKNEVLVVTPPPPALYESIRPLGKVTAVLVLDANHETNLSAFLNKVREETGKRPTVITPKNMHALVEEADHVDEDLETSATIRRFGFEKTLSNHACREHCGATDDIHVFAIDNSTVLIGSCGFGNVPLEFSIWSIISAVLGFVGSGVFRMYRWTFVLDMKKYRQTWRDAIALRPQVFLPQHGTAIKNNCVEEMNRFSI